MAVMMFRQALNLALKEEMRRDEKIFIIGEEVAEYQGAYRVTEGLLAEFGDKRVKDTPIAEEVIAGIGIGAAMVGLRPVVEMMTINFSLLAIDQIVNHAAKMLYMSGGQFNIPLTIRCPEGSGMQLGSQHSQHLEAWFAHIPGLKVVAPSTPYDAKGLLKSSIRDDNPVIFIENQMLYLTKAEVPEDDYTVPIGKADVKREGKDITIIGYMRTVPMAMKVADRLSDEGIEAEIVDLMSLRPLDEETIVNSVKKTGRVMMAEEDWPQYGVGAQVVDVIQKNAFDYLDAPILRVTQADVPLPYARELELSALPTPEKIYNCAMEVLA
ncbi:MAG: pyruvate dehydrogenase complex E1 component subunit beta [Armatimonadota bacterium]